MKIVNLYPQDIINLMKNKDNIINIDTDGIIIKYDEETLIKLYYKKFFNTFLNPTPKTLIDDLDTNKNIEEFLIQNGKIITPLLKEIKDKVIALEQTEAKDLIKGIITCTDYPVGIIIANYKDYEPLNDIKDSLNNKELKKILTTIKYLINNLMENNLYPEALNERNIIVRKSDLDVKLIGLDTRSTRLETENYISSYPHIPKNVLKNYQEIKKILLKK